MIIEPRPHWPAWCAPFLKALIRTADSGRCRPGIACQLVGLARKTPYNYRYKHSDFDSAWSEVSVYVLALERQRLDRRVNGHTADL